MEPITFNARLRRMKPSASLMLMTRAKEMQKKGPSVIGLAGGEPVNVQLDYRTNYTITREKLESAVTPRTRMLILNYPNNPTGRVLSRQEANAIEAFLLAHPQVLVLSDEIYERLRYDGVENVSLASYESLQSRVLTANGFSKCAAMTGWRLGYLVAPKPYFDPIYRLCQHSISCVSSFVQRAGVTALDCTEAMDAMCSILAP